MNDRITRLWPEAEISPTQVTPEPNDAIAPSREREGKSGGGPPRPPRPAAAGLPDRPHNQPVNGLGSLPDLRHPAGARCGLGFESQAGIVGEFDDAVAERVHLAGQHKIGRAHV